MPSQASCLEVGKGPYGTAGDCAFRDVLAIRKISGLILLSIFMIGLRILIQALMFIGMGAHKEN